MLRRELAQSRGRQQGCTGIHADVVESGAVGFQRAGQEGAETPVAAACLRIKRIPVLNRGIAWIAAGPLTATSRLC